MAGSRRIGGVLLVGAVTWLGVAAAPVFGAPGDDAEGDGIVDDGVYQVQKDGFFTQPANAGGLRHNDATTEGTLTATAPDHGILTISNGGSFTYEPDVGYEGPDAFTYVVTAQDCVLDELNPDDFEDAPVIFPRICTDGDIVGNGEVELEVSAGAPASPASEDPESDGAVDDHYLAEQDTELVVPPAHVQENDTGFDETNGLDFADISVTQPLNGTAEILEDGLHYVPDAGFVGLDVFTYTASYGICPEGICEGLLSTQTASVFVQVVPHGTDLAQPEPGADDGNDDGAVDDEYTTNRDVHLIVPAVGVLLNDAPLVNVRGATTIANSQPAHGTAFVDDAGGLHYVPDDGFVGEDSFTYSVLTAGCIDFLLSDLDLPDGSIRSTQEIAQQVDQQLDLGELDSQIETQVFPCCTVYDSRTATVTITVVPPPDPPDPEPQLPPAVADPGPSSTGSATTGTAVQGTGLARTGADVGVLVATGLALLLNGGGYLGVRAVRVRATAMS